MSRNQPDVEEKMMLHDPLCPFDPNATDFSGEFRCALIVRVRADERDLVIKAVDSEIYHAEDNEHVLDWRCQGVAPGEVVPAVRIDHLRAALRNHS